MAKRDNSKKRKENQTDRALFDERITPQERERFDALHMMLRESFQRATVINDMRTPFDYLSSDLRKDHNR